jgi:hypothetical protein
MGLLQTVGLIALILVLTAIFTLPSEIRYLRGLRRAQLSPERQAEIEALRLEFSRLAQEKPWRPIMFELDHVEMGANGFRLHASGEHRGRRFGFAMVFVMAYGPVAMCEWSRTGDESDALLDILADYADVPRADARFGELVKSGAIILEARPHDVAIEQLAQLWSKVTFEFAEEQPEIYLNIDLAGRKGELDEKDMMCRKPLVRAFNQLDYPPDQPSAQLLPLRPPPSGPDLSVRPQDRW